MQHQEYYSHGKLLITGEYVVLDGAKGLAIPTKKGQLLRVEENDASIITWTSFDCHNTSWYKTSIAVSALQKENSPKGNSSFDTTLFKILWQAQQLNPNFLNPQKGYNVTTHLEFERLWGLGSSSTLINSIALWAKVNPFELLALSFGGSGYDIAAASANSPILFNHTQKKYQPEVTPVTFNPKFKDDLFFIYLENKKSSKEAIKNYRSLDADNLSTIINEINGITNQLLLCDHLENFEDLLNQHESLLAKTLKTPTIKTQRFADYPKTIKSLGGWGGDFVLVTATPSDLNYFKEKGYTTIIPYHQMVL